MVQAVEKKSIIILSCKQIPDCRLSVSAETQFSSQDLLEKLLFLCRLT